jgi:hypothetical protein
MKRDLHGVSEIAPGCLGLSLHHIQTHHELWQGQWFLFPSHPAFRQSLALPGLIYFSTYRIQPKMSLTPWEHSPAAPFSEGFQPLCFYSPFFVFLAK